MCEGSDAMYHSMAMNRDIKEMAEELLKYGYVVDRIDEDDESKQKALALSNRRLTLCTKLLWK